MNGVLLFAGKALISGFIGGYAGAYAVRRWAPRFTTDEDGPEKRAAVASAIQTLAIGATFMLLGFTDADPSVSSGASAAPAVAV